MDPVLVRLLPVYLLLLMRNTAWSLTLAGPVMPLYVRELGLDVAAWGMIATASAAGLFCFEIYWGTLADRVDRRLLLLAAAFCLSLIYPLFTFRDLIPFFIVFQFVFGGLTVVIGPTSRAMVMDGTPASSRGFYLSIWYVFSGLGNIAGPVLGTYIASTYGYASAFYASSAILVFAVLVFGASYLRSRGQARREPEPPRVSISGSLRSLLSVRTLRLTCLLAAVIFTVQASFLSFLPIYASERLGMAELDVGAMFTVATALQIAVTPLVGKFSDRVDNRRLLAGIFVASAALFGLIPFASSPVHLYLISAGISVTCVSGVIAMSIHSANTPRNLSGTSIGLYGTFEDLGLIIGSSLYGLSWGSLGPNSVFYLASAASLAGIAVTASLRRGND